MKRLLQGLALLQLFLVIALTVRAVNVWTTPLPEFSEIPELPAVSPIRSPKPPPKVTDAITDGIVGNDLFDDQRGKGEVVVDAPPDLTPVPPPTSVKLVGVMVIGAEPVGILLDPAVRAEQQSVRKGEMFGEYEIGDITPFAVTLLGSGGQQFQIPLRVEAAVAGAVPAAPPPRQPVAPGSAPRPATAAAKAVTARPATTNDASAPEQKVMSARERAQAIAQRNSEMRKNPGGQHNANAGQGDDNNNKNPAPDPVQARLEALRQLREAAKGR